MNEIPPELLEGIDIKMELFDKRCKKTILFYAYNGVPVLYFRTNSGLVGNIGVNEEHDIYIYIHDHATIEIKGRRKKNPTITIKDDEYGTKFRILMEEGKGKIIEFKEVKKK